MGIGMNIRIQRKKQQLTLKQLSEKIGISFGYLSDIERGRTQPSLPTARKIAETLQVPLYELLGEKPRKQD